MERTLIYILCEFTKDRAKAMKQIKYIRLLGFDQKGQTYLNQIKKTLSLPLISKFTREKEAMLEYEYLITKVYSLVFQEPKRINLIEEEYKMKPIRKEEKNETND